MSNENNNLYLVAGFETVDSRVLSRHYESKTQQNHSLDTTMQANPSSLTVSGFFCLEYVNACKCVQSLSTQSSEYFSILEMLCIFC